MLVIYSLCISSAVALCLFVFDKIYYFAPDDYLMNLISRGAFGNGTDAYLIFLNIILGYIIKGMNELIPAINWFVVSYIFTVIYCFTWLIFIFYKKLKNILCAAGLILLEIIVFYHLTFTVVAYLCIATAFLYWKYVITDKYEKMKIMDAVIICSCFCLGISFRKGALLSAICLCIPFIVFHRKKFFGKKNLVLAGSLFLLFIALTSINDYAYSRSEQWEDFKEFNSVRGAVVDNSRVDYEENKEILQEIGISENDLNCVYQWIFADKGVFSSEQMQEIANINSINERFNLNIADILRQMLQLNYNYFFLIVVILALYYSNPKRYCYIIFTALLVYGEIAALYVRNRPVARVMIPIYIIGSMILFFDTENIKAVHAKRGYNIIAAVSAAALVIALSITVESHQQLKDQYEVKNNKYEEVYKYINEYSDYLFVGSSSIINQFSYNDDVLNIGSRLSIGNVLKLGSWDVYSSRYYYQVEKYGIKDPDRLILGIADNENVFYIVDSNNLQEIERLKQYFAEHAGISVDFCIIKSFSDAETDIYRITTDKNQG